MSTTARIVRPGASLTNAQTSAGGTAVPALTSGNALLNAAGAAVTPAALSMSTSRLLGRSTAGTGAVEEITLGTNLSFTGTTLNAAGGGGLPTGLSYSGNVFLQQNGSAAQTYTLERAGDGGANRGYTDFRQDATAGLVIDSVNTGTVAAPTNALDVRRNGASRFRVTANGATSVNHADGSGFYFENQSSTTFGGSPVWRMNASADGYLVTRGDSRGTAWHLGAGRFRASSDGGLAILSTTDHYSASIDLMYGRNATGVGEINNGTSGQFRDLRLRSLIASGVVRVIPVPVGSLPSASASGAGAQATVNDALAPAWGATVAGGGAVTVGVRSDGTNWIVF